MLIQPNLILILAKLVFTVFKLVVNFHAISLGLNPSTKQVIIPASLSVR